MERRHLPSTRENLDKLVYVRTRHERPPATDDHKRAYIRIPFERMNGDLEPVEDR